MMTRQVQKAAVLCIVLCWVFSCPALGAMARKGYVIVNNRSAHTVKIMIKQVNIFGAASWRTIAHVPPGESVTLPDVPQGTELGAQSASDPRMNWPPKFVRYATAPPIFYYNLK